MDTHTTAELAARCTTAAAMVCGKRGTSDVAGEAVEMARDIMARVRALAAEQGLPDVEPLPMVTMTPDATKRAVLAGLTTTTLRDCRAAGIVNLVVWIPESVRRSIQVQANNAYAGRSP